MGRNVGTNGAELPGGADSGRGVGGSENIGATGGGGRSGGAGGSGIVILRIPNTFTASFSGVTVTTDTSSVAGFNIYSVTSGSGTVTFNYE